MKICIYGAGAIGTRRARPWTFADRDGILSSSKKPKKIKARHPCLEETVQSRGRR
jgi:predicted dinucleotide-binding enzyme